MSSKVSKDIALLEIGVCILGVQPNCLLIGSQRLLVALEVTKGIAFVVIRLCIVWVQPNRPLKGNEIFFVLSIALRHLKPPYQAIGSPCTLLGTMMRVPHSRLTE